MNWRRIFLWLAVIVVGYALVTNPAGMAHAVTSVLNGLKGVGSSLSTFFTSL